MDVLLIVDDQKTCLAETLFLVSCGKECLLAVRFSETLYSCFSFSTFNALYLLWCVRCLLSQSPSGNVRVTVTSPLDHQVSLKIGFDG